MDIRTTAAPAASRQPPFEGCAPGHDRQWPAAGFRRRGVAADGIDQRTGARCRARYSRYASSLVGVDRQRQFARSRSAQRRRLCSSGAIRILVAIADVDAVVKPGSPIDDHARINTTSVYTPAAIFSMLPERLSTDLTSLGESQERLALVCDMTIDAAGAVVQSDLYRAWVVNRAKLAYNARRSVACGHRADAPGGRGGGRHGSAASHPGQSGAIAARGAPRPRRARLGNH